MISHIVSTSPSLYITNSTNTYFPNIHDNTISSPNGMMQGVLRINSGRVEVFIGSSWITLSSGTTTVGLSLEVESLLDWVRKKKQEEEEELASLAKKYPIVQSLMEKVENAKKTA